MDTGGTQQYRKRIDKTENRNKGDGLEGQELRGFVGNLRKRKNKEVRDEVTRKRKETHS